jgi:DNA-binding NarL/FixJ family response regulator
MLRSDVRVAILADVGLVGDALAASLAARPPFVLSGVLLPTQRNLMMRLSAARPDIVIIDADADAEAGDLVRAICDVLRAVPRASVVVVGDQPDAFTAVAAARAGAAAWCDRATSVERLVDVMLGVHHGEAWFPPRLLREMLRLLTASTPGAWGGDADGDATGGVRRPRAGAPTH